MVPVTVPFDLSKSTVDADVRGTPLLMLLDTGGDLR